MRHGDMSTVLHTPVVSIDESRRTIDLVLEVEEGRPYDFGKLYLEGALPRRRQDAIEFVEAVGRQAVQLG
jgi:hypothetical protein